MKTILVPTDFSPAALNAAHYAAEIARFYVENHFDLALVDIFRGTHQACLNSRGVVMALAHIDLRLKQISFASVGNINACLYPETQPLNAVIRRGVLGYNLPNMRVNQQALLPRQLLIMHSDGIHTINDLATFSQQFSQLSASDLANYILQHKNNHLDDATVLVMKT